ncbi:hypothetical protein [Pedobacter sp. FW305-3-2-15-E-R2A2]|uniref:hypothetical protein n=1 Tax=Pedobacter sp. FW305-3-2-15-E-R2A2 TaxID=3140251 RepID=UPI00313FE6E5
MANWYSFGGCCDGVYDRNNYRKTSVKPSCNLGINVCAIYLNDTADLPSAITLVELYIANALATQTAQPIGVGVKRFVYLRGPVS